jgi:murein DD-endopeptidase MepM/ murein hydrolase activator NlpD
MRIIIFFLILVLGRPATSQLSNKVIHDYKGGRVYNDTSYVYWLPYVKGKSYLVIQAANSQMSHKNELAIDFKMKPGTKICAARPGVVVEMKEDSDIGGLDEKFMEHGNHIIIRHSDGTMAKYWHLQKNGAYVEVGEDVVKGQIIGLSGNTGYSAFPHLHFKVVNIMDRHVLVRFATRKGAKYLRPAQRYRSIRN